MKGDPCSKCSKPVEYKGRLCYLCQYYKYHTSKKADNRRRKYERQNEIAGRPRPEHCEVCGRKPEKHNLHFDHDHGTEKFRGWICGLCNKALGQAGDNPEILRALAEYLERNPHTPKRELCKR